MRIENVESFLVRIPLGRDEALKTWRGGGRLDYVLVRIDTDAGISGWGDVFGYGAARASKAALDHMIGPALIGQDARDIAGISHRLQLSNHIWGRYGATMFAIGGVDIALWDLAGKAAGKPLHELLGGKLRDAIPAYASLPKYQDPEIVAERTAYAVGQGYRHVKLHETTVPEVAASREAGGPDFGLMIDTNCPWNPREADEMAAKFKPYDPFWLEEPLFPPENFAGLAALGQASGIPIAAGENACTSWEFQKMFEAGAVSYAQPSVTKVGGITEFRKVAALCESFGVQIMPHSPYFGPGFLATLHLAQALPNPGLIERIFITPEADFYPGAYDPVDGFFGVPSGPGLGIEPDPDLIKTYRVG